MAAEAMPPMPTTGGRMSERRPTELGRMLDVYRRRGFDTLSDAERHVLSELQLAALVDVQETLQDIRESMKLLSLMQADVSALKAWRETVDDPLRDVIEDR